MTTEASLRIRVDSSEAAKADKTLDDLAKTGAKAEGSTTKLTTSTERLSSAARVAAGAFAALGLSVSVREIVQANDAWQSAANQLRLVTSSAAELTKTQSALMMVANDTRSSFESTANLYARLSRATSEMGLSQTELLGITETINQSFAVSGATAAEAAAAITQLSQGLAAGALRGDEFNSVAEQSPGIMRAIADSLNMTVGELRAFAAEGGITADIVVKALQGASDSIANDFGKSVATFGQSVQIAQNNFIEFAGTSDTVNTGMAALSAIVVNASEGFDELGDALDYTVGMAGDFSEVMGASVSPLLSDISFFVMALRDGFVEFGGAVTETGATVQTGIVQLDAIVNAFFDNFSTGAVSAAELFSLAFGTAVPNTVSVVQTATVAIADAVERMKVIITKSGAEEAAALQALDSIRNRSVTEIIAARDGELSQLYELIKAQAENRKSVSDLVVAVDDATETTEESTEATEEAVKLTKEQTEEQERLQKAYDKSRDSLEDTTLALENELLALQMTARAAAVFEAVTKATAEGALPAEIARVAELTAKLYDMKEAKSEATEAAKALEKANDEAARNSAEAWGRTHEFLADTFVDIFNEGGSAFEKVGDMAVATAKRIAAEWLALKAMNLFGITPPSGAGGGGLSSLIPGGGGGGLRLPSFGGGGGGGGGGAPVVTSNPDGFVGPPEPGLSSTAAAAGPAATAASTAITAIKTAGAGYVGSQAGNKVGEEVFDKQAGSNIGSTIGSTVGAYFGGPLGAAIGGFIGGLGDVAFGTDGEFAGNGGFLIRGRNGENEFDVPPFASGFDPVGFARRDSQGAAVQIIDTFRQYDAYLTEIAKASGLRVNYNSNNFGGFDEKGRGAGTFFGVANEGDSATNVPVEQQLTQFVGQWIRGLSGQVDPALINDVLAQGSADEMLKRAAMLAGVDGSHANGLDYVPFDGYRAELHKGERVQTASQARGSDDAINKLASEFATMRSMMAETAMATRRTADLLLRVTKDGQSLQTTAA